MDKVRRLRRARGDRKAPEKGIETVKQRNAAKGFGGDRKAPKENETAAKGSGRPQSPEIRK